MLLNPHASVSPSFKRAGENGTQLRRWLGELTCIPHFGQHQGLSEHHSSVSPWGKHSKEEDAWDVRGTARRPVELKRGEQSAE